MKRKYWPLSVPRSLLFHDNNLCRFNKLSGEISERKNEIEIGWKENKLTTYDLEIIYPSDLHSCVHCEYENFSSNYSIYTDQSEGKASIND
jgi:hypothetical protein